MCQIDQIGYRLFIPNSHFKITHMPSYYDISLRQRNGEQKVTTHLEIWTRVNNSATLSNHVSNTKLGIGWQRCKQTLADLVYFSEKIIKPEKFPMGKNLIDKKKRKSK